MNTGRIHQINISQGGVPKLPVDSAQVTTRGLEGDNQTDKEHHGGPDRAICLYSLELIQRLQAEGHPIQPGTTGENLTITGIDWSQVIPGCKFIFDNVTLEITSYAQPCKTIAGSFINGESKRIAQKLHPQESRVYAKVLVEGTLQQGDHLKLISASDASKPGA